MFGGEKDREMHCSTGRAAGPVPRRRQRQPDRALNPQDRQVCLDYIGEVMETLGYTV